MTRFAFECCVALTVVIAGCEFGLCDDSFPKVFNTEKADVKFLSPQEALAGIKVADGFEVSLFAAEPDVQQPISMATDDRGRLWVAENYSYAEREVNFEDRLRDRVVILEDTNNDGKHDKRTVFWDKGRRLTSVEIGYGGVWILDAPNLYFIPDGNGDDVPDGEPIVKLNGWDDDAVRHNIVNGLRWGPDGWLYGRHGILATSNVGIPGATAEQRTPINCGIWRFHPKRNKFEVVCHGTTNAWGMDWDQHGELFFINTVIGHLWHAVPGSYLRRMYGEHFNPNVYQVIEQTADHFHWDTKETWSDIRKLGVTKTTDEAGGGHAHSGMVIVPPGLWGKQYDSSVLAVNLHGRRINRDRLIREGATYSGKHAPDFLSVADPYFRGVELHFGPYGVLYVADWSDVGECHENDGVHRTSGRIYRIAPKHPKRSGGKPKLTLQEDQSLERLDPKLLALVACSEHPWLAKHARRRLAEEDIRKADRQMMHVMLESVLRPVQSDASIRLNALWALHATGGATERLLQRLLNDPSENIRVWAIRLLVDDDVPSSKVISKFEKMAATDKSGLVLTYLASALQRLPTESRLPIAANLVRHTRFAEDRVLPLMIWYGIEGAVPADPEAAILLAAQSKIPLVREFIARRVTQDIERTPDVVDTLVAFLGKSTADAFRLDVLHGMSAGLRGWRKAPSPGQWAIVAEELGKSSNEEVRTLGRELSVVFGDGRALDELRKIAKSGSSVDERRSAIRALVVARAERMVPLLQNLLGDRDVAKQAINGLAAFGSPDTPKLLVSRYSGFRHQARLEAVNTLVSRPGYASVLLDAVAAASIPKNDVSAFQLRQMQSYGDAKIAARVSELWPELKELSAEKINRIAELKQALTPEVISAADAPQGRYLFSRSCANCHTLFGEGKKLAPDLTGAQRSNLNYLLENIVDPSATVSKNFRMSIILTEDGRVFNGVIVARAEKTITLQTATELVVIRRADIDESSDSNLSMMPENLLNVLNEQQVTNLIAYLMSPAQVPLPTAPVPGPVKLPSR